MCKPPSPTTFAYNALVLSFDMLTFRYHLPLHDSVHGLPQFFASPSAEKFLL